MKQRLIADGEISAASALPAALIAHIMAAADAFAGSAPQYDDMTLVVARCTIGSPASGSVPGLMAYGPMESGPQPEARNPEPDFSASLHLPPVRSWRRRCGRW